MSRNKRQNKTVQKEDGYYRLSPKGKEYRQCEAYVQDEDESDYRRLCRAAAMRGDQLCGVHARKRKYVNNPYRFVIYLSKKGSVPLIGSHGQKIWPKFAIGKCFITREDAELWCSLNGTLIWAIPQIKSYSISRIRWEG